MKNYYEVIAKCGHVGRNNYIPISFAVVAQNGKDAARIARELPRVKHHQKDAIILVRKISEDEYADLSIKNYKDEYLQCKNKQMQNEINDLYLRIERNYEDGENLTNKRENVLYKLKKYKSMEASLKRQILEWAMWEQNP